MTPKAAPDPSSRRDQNESPPNPPQFPREMLIPPPSTFVQSCENVDWTSVDPGFAKLTTEFIAKQLWAMCCQHALDAFRKTFKKPETQEILSPPDSCDDVCPWAEATSWGEIDDLLLTSPSSGARETFHKFTSAVAYCLHAPGSPKLQGALKKLGFAHHEKSFEEISRALDLSEAVDVEDPSKTVFTVMMPFADAVNVYATQLESTQDGSRMACVHVLFGSVLKLGLLIDAKNCETVMSCKNSVKKKSLSQEPVVQMYNSLDDVNETFRGLPYLILKTFRHPIDTATVVAKLHTNDMAAALIEEEELEKSRVPPVSRKKQKKKARKAGRDRTQNATTPPEEEEVVEPPLLDEEELLLPVSVSLNASNIASNVTIEMAREREKQALERAFLDEEEIFGIVAETEEVVETEEEVVETEEEVVETEEEEVVLSKKALIEKALAIIDASSPVSQTPPPKRANNNVDALTIPATLPETSNPVKANNIFTVSELEWRWLGVDLISVLGFDTRTPRHFYG